MKRRVQKASSRHRIVRSAVDRLRSSGMGTTSIADVMADAGLTIGGFYAHFDSKEALADAAVREGLQERREQFLARYAPLDWKERIDRALAEYFTPQHRDGETPRCPMPMAAVDAARDGLATETFADEMARMAGAFQTGHHADRPSAPREAALGSLALMIGGMLIARAATGTPLSAEMLEAARSYGNAALTFLENAHRRRPSKAGRRA